MRTCGVSADGLKDAVEGHGGLLLCGGSLESTGWARFTKSAPSKSSFWRRTRWLLVWYTSEPGGTLVVRKTLPPMTLSAPMTVSPPSTVALA